MDDDEYNNALIATGALLAMLRAGADEVVTRATFEVVMRNGDATNQLRARFNFLKSPYIITVERDPSEDE